MPKFVNADLVTKQGDKFEPGSTKVWKRELRNVSPRSVVLDIGAYNGYYGLIAAEKRDDIDVHMFEPLQENWQSTHDNIKVNGHDPKRVRLYAAAVSDRQEDDKPKHMPLNRFSTVKNTSGCSLEDIDPCGRKSKEKIPVPVVFLDTAYAHACVSLVKIDVEGAELHVLKGTRSCLSQGMIKRLIVEVANPKSSGKSDNARAVYDLMTANDYAAWIIDSDFMMPWKPEFCFFRQDLLFVRKQDEAASITQLKEYGVTIHEDPTEDLIAVLESRIPA